MNKTQVAAKQLTALDVFCVDLFIHSKHRQSRHFVRFIWRSGESHRPAQRRPLRPNRTNKVAAIFSALHHVIWLALHWLPFSFLFPFD